jgi:glycosyltransferase involved in cell wall biosynthesis
MNGPIVLDVSRLLSRAERRVPTGIDRVEHAYAEGLLRVARHRLRYAAVHPLGRFCHLPTARTRAFVERIGQEWENQMPTTPAGEGSDARTLAWRIQASMILPRTAPRFLRQEDGRPTYLLVSHHHLHQPEAIQAARRKLGAAFVCFIHDLIPIEFPEFGRAREADKHRRRIRTAARFADGFVVNSASTRDALLPFMREAGREVPLLVAPLGVHDMPGAGAGAGAELPAAPRTEERPYFLYVGTIEPRKNHLLLFNIWRRLVQELGPAAPRLVLVGQRGWENEMVVDVLERSELLRDHITEHNALPDKQVQALIAGARAVLLPSFAEGYGLPLAEALSAGTPVLCSDLPALREVGGDAPEYLDPLDGLGWAAAIHDYLDPASPRRAAQLARIGGWSRPGWAGHIEAVLALIGTVAATPSLPARRMPAGAGDPAR